MIIRRASAPSLSKVLLACCGILAGASVLSAETSTRFAAHYVISMTHVTVGEITWSANLSDTSYLSSAVGKASGVLSVLVTGEGSLTTRGTFADRKPAPAVARFDVNDDDGVYETEIAFEDGVLKRVVDRGAPPPADRVPVSAKLLRDATDPLSAFMIPFDGKALASANCNRTLQIFDGRRRYDLTLSYKRHDSVQLARGYSGPVLVCAVVLYPLGGYRPDSLLVRYLAGKKDLELWFAPIVGVPVIAPVRALMPTLVGTMDISADEFMEHKATPATAAPAKPAPVEQAPSAPEAVAKPAPVEVAPLAPPKP